MLVFLNQNKLRLFVYKCGQAAPPKVPPLGAAVSLMDGLLTTQYITPCSNIKPAAPNLFHQHKAPSKH